MDQPSVRDSIALVRLTNRLARLRSRLAWRSRSRLIFRSSAWFTHLASAWTISVSSFNHCRGRRLSSWSAAAGSFGGMAPIA